MILYGFRELNSVRVLVLKIQLKMQYQQDCPSPPSPVTEVLFSVNVRRPTAYFLWVYLVRNLVTYKILSRAHASSATACFSAASPSPES